MSIINYAAPPTIGRFMRSDDFMRLLMGPFGSGKSVGMIMEMLRRAHEQAPDRTGKRRTRWAIVRNTYPELRDTTKKTWDDWVPAVAGEWSVGEFSFMLRTGDVEAEFLFRALDRPEHVKKLLSLELTGAWVNEAREVPYAVVKMLLGRLRRFPAMKDGVGPTWSGLILDTNPPDDDSWIYNFFEEERPINASIFKQPGGRTPQAENLGHWETPDGMTVGFFPQDKPAGARWVPHLDPNYYTDLATVNASDAEWVKGHVDGQYASTRTGKPIYPEFVHSTHVQEPSKLPADAPLLLGMDFGLTPALAFAQRDPSDGQLQFVDELVADDLGAARFAEDAVRYLGREYKGRPISGHGDPGGEQRAQTDERTAFDIVNAAGLPLSPCHTNDFTVRREAVGRGLTRLTLRGRPAIVFGPKCKKLIKAMGGRYQYRRISAPGETRFRDVPDKNEYSHIAEAAQYLAVGEGEDSPVLTSRYEQQRRPVKWKTKTAGVRRRTQ